MAGIIVREYTVKHTVTVTQICPNSFITFGEFRETRQQKGLSLRKFTKCVACTAKFVDTDEVFLCVVQGEGNMFMCEKCKGGAANGATE
jgi:hypothetical protein